MFRSYILYMQMDTCLRSSPFAPIAGRQAVDWSTIIKCPNEKRKHV